MPKEDPTIEATVWEKRAEPAKKVLLTAHRMRFQAAIFGVLIIVSAVLGLVNSDASKSFFAAFVFQINMFNALGLFYVAIDYLSYGVRKVLKSGKVASFGAKTTTATTAVSSNE